MGKILIVVTKRSGNIVPCVRQSSDKEFKTTMTFCGIKKGKKGNIFIIKWTNNQDAWVRNNDEKREKRV